MGDELTSLLEMYHLVKKTGRSATLTLSSKGGKATTAQLVIELDDAAPPPASTSTSSRPSTAAAPAPRSRRQRRRSRAAKAKANARAAQHQANQASPTASPASGDATSAPLGRPLLPFPPPPRLPAPTRRLVTVLRRRANTWTSFRQLDGEAEETPSPPSSPLPHWAGYPCSDGECEENDHCSICKRCCELCPDHQGCSCRGEYCRSTPCPQCHLPGTTNEDWMICANFLHAVIFSSIFQCSMCCTLG